MFLSSVHAELIDDMIRRNLRGISPCGEIEAHPNQAPKELAAERRKKKIAAGAACKSVRSMTALSLVFGAPATVIYSVTVAPRNRGESSRRLQMLTPIIQRGVDPRFQTECGMLPGILIASPSITKKK